MGSSSPTCAGRFLTRHFLARHRFLFLSYCGQSYDWALVQARRIDTEILSS